MTARAPSEADRQALIVSALKDAGRIAIRVQSGKVKVRGGWMQLAPPGTPDLYVLGFGWLETKDEKGKLRKAQKLMHARIHVAGERVATVRTPAEALRVVLTAGGEP